MGILKTHRLIASPLPKRTHLFHGLEIQRIAFAALPIIALLSLSCGEGTADTSPSPTTIAPRLDAIITSPAIASPSATRVILTFPDGQIEARSTCTIDGETVASGDTITLPETLPSRPRQLTLSCTNTAGTTTRTLTIPTLPALPERVDLPGPGTYDLGPLSLEVPEGAIPPSGFTLTLHWRGDEAPHPGLLTAPVDLGPDGSTFNRPLKLTYTYDPELLASLGITHPRHDLGALHEGKDGWHRIAADVDEVNHQITAYVSHFSNIAYDTLRNDQATKPTKSAFSIIAKAEEIALWTKTSVGMHLGGTIWEDFFEAGSSTPKVLSDLPSSPCGNYPAARTWDVRGADLDADGKQELIALCTYSYDRKTIGTGAYRDKLRFKLVVYHQTINGYVRWKEIDSGSWNKSTLPSDEFITSAHLAIGNFDNDIADEIAFVANAGKFDNSTGNFVIETRAHFWVLDDAIKSYALLLDKAFNTSTTLNIAAGNIDKDGADEIAVVYRHNERIEAKIYDDQIHAFSRLKILNSAPDNWNVFNQKGMRNPSIAIADIDGDDRGEIAVTAMAASKVLTELFEDPDASYRHIRHFRLSPHTGVSFDTYREPTVIRIADLDSDSIDELVFLAPVAYSDDDFRVYTYWNYRRDSTAGVHSVKVEQTFRLAATNSTTKSDRMQHAMLAVGDVDQDRRDEILIVFHNTDPQPAKNFRVVRWDFQVDSPKLTKTDYDRGNSGDTMWPVIGVLDLDGDNIKLQYTGDNYASISDPIPLVAIAAPPQFRSLMKNYHPTDPATRLQGSGTADYGKTNTMGVETASSVSYGRKLTWSLDMGLSFKVFISAGMGIDESVEQAYTSSVAKTDSVTFGTNYQGSPDHDQVVFLIQYYQSYLYRIISHPDASFLPHYDAKAKKWIYHYTLIDVPKGDPVPYNMPISTFKETYPKFAYWFDGIFHHTPGFPDTYMNRDEVDKLIVNATPSSNGAIDDPNDHRFRGWWKKDEYLTLPIGGQASTSASITLSNETINTGRSRMTYTTGWHYQYPGSGGEHGESRSVSSESSYAIKVGSSVSYSGAVGGVVKGCFNSATGLPIGPCANLDAFNYDWNMFVYNYQNKKDKTIPPFQVINFWVDDSLYSVTKDWYFYESFADIKLVPRLMRQRDWTIGASSSPNTVAAFSFDTCEIGNGKLLCDDNPTLASQGMKSGGGIGRIQAVFTRRTNEYVYYEVKAAKGKLDPQKAKKLTIRYRVTGSRHHVEAFLGVIPAEQSQYWTFNSIDLAPQTLPSRGKNAMIPNEKGEESNRYDTGWKTKTFDLSTLVTYDYDRLILALDNVDRGVFRLYVDYIRIE